MSSATRPFTWVVAAIAALALAKAFVPQVEPQPEIPTPDPHVDRAPDSSKNPGEISAEAFSGQWPFVTGKAVVRCMDPHGKSALVVTLGSETFALNGTARSYGYPDLGAHWLDDDEIPGAKISLAEVIEHGRQLCRE